MRDEPGKPSGRYTNNKVIRGYQTDPIQIDLPRVKQLTGIISLAYSGFGLAFVGFPEYKKRMELGHRLINETGLFMSNE